MFKKDVVAIYNIFLLTKKNKERRTWQETK